MKTFTINFDFAKPNTEDGWGTEGINQILPEIRKCFLYEPASTVSGKRVVSEGGDEYWALHLMVQDETITNVFESLEKVKKVSPFLFYTKVTPVMLGDEAFEYNLSLFNYLSCMPMSEIFNFFSRYTKMQVWKPIKDEIQMNDLLINNPVEAWRIDLANNRGMVIHAALLNMLAYERFDELSEYLATAGYDLSGVSPSWIFKGLDLTFPQTEISFRFTGNKQEQYKQVKQVYSILLFDRFA